MLHLIINSSVNVLLKLACCKVLQSPEFWLVSSTLSVARIRRIENSVRAFPAKSGQRCGTLGQSLDHFKGFDRLSDRAVQGASSNYLLHRLALLRSDPHFKRDESIIPMQREGRATPITSTWGGRECGYNFTTSMVHTLCS